MEAAIKALIVDDTSFMRKKIIDFLVSQGFASHNFTEAEDGEDAIKKLKESTDFHLIICDLNMPNMDGLEFLKKIRNSTNEKVREFKFLLLTTESEKTKIVQAIKLKVNGYIIKQSMEEKLVSEIMRIVGS